MNTVVLSSEKELAEWRTRIESAWQKSVQSVIEVGNLVKQAKEQLGVSYSLRPCVACRPNCGRLSQTWCVFAKKCNSLGITLSVGTILRLDSLGI